MTVAGVPSEEVYSMPGMTSRQPLAFREKGLLHLLEGHLVENFPWSAWGDHQQAKVLLSGHDQGGVWLAFWPDGGVLYFKDGQVRASYTAANGLGKGAVAGLRLDRDGALWAATTGWR